MNRAQRRQKQRTAQEYDKKQLFTKKELEVMNEQSYALGVEYTLQAMQEALGIGPVRLERVKEQLRWIEYQNFTLYFQEVGRKKNV